MSTITSKEIMELYKKCGLSESASPKIRTTINTGTMSNKLNVAKLASKGKDEMRVRV